MEGKQRARFHAQLKRIEREQQRARADKIADEVKLQERYAFRLANGRVIKSLASFADDEQLEPFSLAFL